MTLRSAVPCLLLAALGPSCGKVPLHDVGAGFAVADAAWFEEEETLFLFYRVEAEQGLGAPSVIEASWVTDTERVDWTDVDAFEPVHTHVPVDCGIDALCGSTSVHVPGRPRDVALRLRYHRDGELDLEARTVFNVVGEGPDHTKRSLLVYGVFDEANERIQWRARHQFPTIRNEQATDLGLRRTFTVRDIAYGSVPTASAGNPYGYGVTCPSDHTLTNLAPVQTDTRAVFHPDPLPLGASAARSVCATSEVTDALGAYTTGATAQKNPEVAPAFPELRSVVEDAVAIPFFLGPCDRVIDADHEAMQRQRLQMEDVPTTCIDDWDARGFADGLAVAFRDAVEAARAAEQRDMVLTIAIHHDESGVAGIVEDALALVLPNERHRNTPRVAGAFVLDSDTRGLRDESLDPVVLWCPSTIPLEGGGVPSVSEISCAIAPDIPGISLGPLSVAQLPILPPRDQYLEYIDTYGVNRAGEVLDLRLRVPEFPTTADHADLGTFGVVTFLDGEAIDAEPDDAFSYCMSEDYEPFVFRTPLLQDPRLPAFLDELCRDLGEELCTLALAGALPVQLLPEWHDQFPETPYELGLYWEFPFLVQMDYEVAQSGAVSAFGFSVPFGPAETAEAYYGSASWQAEVFDLSSLLTQCTRFCDHPTFDGAGVYHPTDSFRDVYRQACYLPRYPEPGDGGYPRDP